MSGIYIPCVNMPTERESFNLTIKYNGTVLDTETGMQVAEAHELSAADVRPVVRSEWIGKMTAGGMMAVCHNCGKEVGFADVSNFCHNCGADMRGGDAE